ncbi:MAG: hypothetical protein HKN82_09215 [Akkermansiaceae bacterium]|nr:hypothetical protein [Akkermansiaceae bacterium]NNM30564.1 hypothetical protein [Akkermansiaceae bacterium]
MTTTSGETGALAAVLVLAAVLTAAAAPDHPRLRVDPRDFEASRADIENLLQSASRALWKEFPGYALDPIVVVRGRKDPITLFERNARGEIVVQLNTGSTYWAQYSYQWAHEFCHILCGFRKQPRENNWFEETLCELASLYVLRAMGTSWEHDPPYPNWKEYRHSLRAYADDVMAKREKLTPDGLARFYKLHEGELRGNGIRRDLNGAMAGALLPLLEEDPSRWEAVRWLNAAPATKGMSFRDYLAKWSAAAPPRHRPFIARLAALFGQRGR